MGRGKGKTGENPSQPRRSPDPKQLLDGLIEGIMKADLPTLEPNEDLPPAVLVHDGSRGSVIPLLNAGSEERKEMALAFELPAAVILSRAVSALLCSHGWVSPEIKPSDDPQRLEVFQAYGMDRNGNVVHAFAPVERSETSSPTLGEWTVQRYGPGQFPVMGALAEGMARAFDYLAANGPAATVENFANDLQRLMAVENLRRSAIYN